MRLIASERFEEHATPPGHPERMGRLALSVERVLPARLARMVATFVETFAQGLAVR